MENWLEMDRRRWLAQAFMLIGASVAPGMEATSLAAAARAKPNAVLGGEQMALLSAVADTIMPANDTPGAVGAGVPAKLNGMLTTWAAPSTRAAIINALGKIDVAAKTAKAKAFATLSKADRLAVLTAHDAAALKKVPLKPGAPKGHPFAPIVSVADHDYYRLKALIMALYYSSEVAMTQELVFDPVPGAWQPSVKVDASTRPWAAIGPF